MRKNEYIPPTRHNKIYILKKQDNSIRQFLFKKNIR